jgi:protein-tyrosine phosphatase
LPAHRPRPTPPPLPIDWIPQEVLGLPGRLGLTCVPGALRRETSLEPDRRLRDDLAAMAREEGVTTLVTLLSEYDVSDMLGDEFGNLAQREGIEWLHLPVEDGWVPEPPEGACRLVARILERLRTGRRVVIHCLAGLGRTGTIAACCLVALGRRPREAMARVRAARPGAIQTPPQERFVEEFPELWASCPGDAVG